jgi:hypothetical protein
MNDWVLVTTVVVNAGATIALWRMMATKASRPAGLNKKAAKALWHSDPILPKHDPPKVPGGDYPSMVRDADKVFFADFKEFSDVVNWFLADDYVASRFFLQDLPDGDVRLNIGFDSGPVPGRCFALYYNQTRLGRIEIHAQYEYTTETPKVFTSVQIDWSRLLGFGTITNFLSTIADHVAAPNPKSDEHVDAQRRIQTALTELLWDKYRISEFDRVFANEEDMDWGELNVCFRGSADWYIKRRNAWQKTSPRNSAKAGSE